MNQTNHTSPIPPQLSQYLTDCDLFQTAVTHRSYVNEHPESQSYERLEFLGDAVLEYLVSSHLYHQFADQPEGVLTALRSQIVNTQALSQVARQLKLGQYLRLATGERQNGGRENNSILEDVVEALIGAIYLDRGMPAARQFVQDHILPLLNKLDLSQLKDPKSLLQELVQARKLPTPEYQIVQETGPDHAKQFTVKVLVKGREWGRGQGKSKQKAQQAAAAQALEKLTPQTRTGEK